MKRRCNKCRCLQVESPVQYAKRIKHNFKAKFFCKKCRKTTEQILDQAFLEDGDAQFASLKKESIKKRRKFESATHSLSKSTKLVEMISFQESCAMGMFKRKCPKNCLVSVIDLLAPMNFENLKYAPRIDPIQQGPHEKEFENAEKWTNEIKTQCLKTYPFTPIPETPISLTKKRSSSKYKKIRRIAKK